MSYAGEIAGPAAETRSSRLSFTRPAERGRVLVDKAGIRGWFLALLPGPAPP